MSGIKIKDPMYGFVELNETERRIIDTPAFQRLRYVKQLGFTYLTYPGALHTRFDHSIGTMHAAGLMAKTLAMDEDEIALVRLLGLLHDIGHGPFSHSFEAALLDSDISTRHEATGKEHISKGEIGDILRENYQLNTFLKYMKEGIYADIIKSPIGADRIDYLRRDAYHVGVNYGIIDYDRVIEKVVRYKEQLAIDIKGLDAAESLLTARSNMFSAVYLHTSVRIADMMFAKALAPLLREEDIKRLFALSDDELWVKLLNDPRSRPWANRLRNRRLLKVVRSFALDEKERACAFAQKHGLYLYSPLYFVKHDPPLYVRTEEGSFDQIAHLSPLVSFLEDRIQQHLRYLVLAEDDTQRKQVLEKLRNDDGNSF